MRYYSNSINDRTNGHDEELERIMQRKMNEFSLRTKRNDRIEGNQSATTTPITLTDQNFNEMVGKHPLLIVDFWAPWCGPCKMVSPDYRCILFDEFFCNCSRYVRYLEV